MAVTSGGGVAVGVGLTSVGVAVGQGGGNDGVGRLQGGQGGSGGKGGRQSPEKQPQMRIFLSNSRKVTIL